MAKKEKSSVISHGTVARNRKAYHNFTIEDKIEAGIMLLGTEVKSLRLGRANISESYAVEMGGELYLQNVYIAEYSAGGHFGHEARRLRKLLLHKKEMNKLMGAINREGATVVPLSLYFNNRGIAKVELGIAKGKKKHDKRQSEKDRDWKRDKARIMRDKG